MLIDWPFKITPHTNINNMDYENRMKYISVCVKYFLDRLENK